MGNTFPYQETEAYKNLIMEYREKVFSGMKDVSTEEPLILSCEEKNKEFGQSFTLEGCQERMNVISKFKCRIVNAFKTRKSNLEKNSEKVYFSMDCPAKDLCKDQIESESSTSDTSSCVCQKIPKTERKKWPVFEKSVQSQTGDTTDNNDNN